MEFSRIYLVGVGLRLVHYTSNLIELARIYLVGVGLRLALYRTRIVSHTKIVNFF